MSIEETVQVLQEHGHVTEFYVLVREMKLYLKFNGTDWGPRVGIRVYRTTAYHNAKYSFATSHHVHTPAQAGPYWPSDTSAPSEQQAIRNALRSLTDFVEHALREGHEPSDRWLVADEDF